MSPRKVQHSDKPKEIGFKSSIDKVNDNLQDQLIPANEVEVHSAYAIPREDNDPAFVEIKEEPQTPAFLNLISPSSSQPSETQFGFISGRPASPRPCNARGSRRARSQVSYAEPNLISKMRRPTKDLVDAVARNSKQSSSSVTCGISSIKKEEQEEDAKGLQLTGVRTILINKVEPLGKDWKPSSASTNQTIMRPDPQSPLRDKEEAPKQQISTDRLTSRERRRSTFHPTDRGARQSLSSAANSTPMASGHEAAEGEMDMQGTEPSLQRALESLDIYDVKDFSPPPTLSHSASPAASEKSHGGTSSRPPNARPPSRTDLHRATSTGSAPRITSTRPNSRRQTLSSNSNGSSNGVPTAPNPTTTTGAARATEPQPPRWNSSKDLKAVISAAASAETAKDGNGGGGVGPKGERMANRRRSMML